MTSKRLLNCAISDLARELNGFDVFICCSSFESRSLSIARALSGVMPRETYVARYNHRPSAAEKHFSVLRQLCGPTSKSVDLQLSDPIQSADALHETLLGVRKCSPSRVVIDVSTFTHETVLVLYRLVRLLLGRDTSVIFLYTGASEYSIGDADGAKWLSRGIREVRSVVGYPVALLPTQGIHLILLVGFEIERAMGLIREFEPRYVSLGYGDKTIPETAPHQAKNTQAISILQRAENLATAVDLFSFNPYSPEESCAAVQEQLLKRSGLNTIIAPMNTKLSTLGVAKVSESCETVQVCYAQPLVYNSEKYSTPRDDVWMWHQSDA